MANKQTPVKIKEGYYKIARMINRSEIWQTKPSWWFKVWTYLIGHVNHADTGVFHRGTNFVSLQMIWNDCFLINDGIKDCKTVHNVIRWLKNAKQITTRKTTRGFIVTICNYELYQNGLNYGNETENDTVNDTGTTQERFGNDTINNNVKMEEEINIAAPIKEIVEYYKNVKGFNAQADWDKHHFPRHVRAAKDLFVVAMNDWKDAIDWVSRQGYSWTLETVIKKIPDFRQAHSEGEGRWKKL